MHHARDAALVAAVLITWRGRLLCNRRRSSSALFVGHHNDDVVAGAAATANAAAADQEEDDEISEVDVVLARCIIHQNRPVARIHIALCGMNNHKHVGAR